MKKIFTVVILALFAANAFAQLPCIPDTVRYRDSLVGVFPNPVIGINTPACIGKPYNFTFTIKASDSIRLSGLAFRLDSVTMNTSTGITGMPAGLTYACNPPRCVFPRNSVGCVNIRGTVPTGTAVRDYALLIAVKAYIEFLGAQDITFPGLFYPGEYKIKVLAATDTYCMTLNNNDLSQVVSRMTVEPNPTQGTTNIRVVSNTSDKFQFAVVDMLGRVHYATPLSIATGENNFSFDAGELPNGIYFAKLSLNNNVMTQKIVVNR